MPPSTSRLTCNTLFGDSTLAVVTSACSCGAAPPNSVRTSSWAIHAAPSVECARREDSGISPPKVTVAQAVTMQCLAVDAPWCALLETHEYVCSGAEQRSARLPWRHGTWEGPRPWHVRAAHHNACNEGGRPTAQAVLPLRC
ncbi:hypothetical protein XFF6992_710030 [Xanthomonas citri pv. fuscans]|nr:hypothetical protein XFF6992_190091 [Xanthomonas citri pv. fuscans]SOO18780.1 hypothetical protein XFF6992_260089 [Xanthomonas citri pv. fuscans]SOO21715.1 hypothetical protein XFF6992_710030 [Xanthomonas citri pv. fuscans]